MDTNNFYIKSKEYIVNTPKKTAIIIIVIIIAVILLLALGIGGYFYWKAQVQKTLTPAKSATEQAVQDIQNAAAKATSNIGDSVSPNVTIPTGAPTNTNANPYDKTNSFASLNINPFK
jgi:flagellar basal body-associated protein FliL